LLSNDLWRWFRHHRASTLHDLPDDLLRACTVAVFYFLTTYVLKRRSHKERGV
jgi:hypothetical protein